MNKRQQKIFILNIYILIIICFIILTLFIFKAYGMGQENTKNGTRYIYPTQHSIVLETEINALKYSLNDAREIKDLLSESNYIGEFEVTYYTAGYESCGKLPSDPLYGITASGEPVKENHTIAADLSMLPLGTKIYVEGLGIRVVTDSGTDIVGNRLDNYVEKLEDIPSIGRHMAKVYILK